LFFFVKTLYTLAWQMILKEEVVALGNPLQEEEAMAQEEDQGRPT
jgi:hypothetical protein